MRKNKNSKGFSLVEVIVSMLVVSIILTFATSFFFTGEKMFSNAIKGNTSKMVGDNVLDFITQTIKFASKIEIRNNSQIQDASYDNVLWINSDNRLGLKTEDINDFDIYGEDFYNKNKLELNVEALSDTSVFLQVKVISIDNPEEIYITSNTIKLVNLDMTKSSIEVVGSAIGETITNPVISFEKPLYSSGDDSGEIPDGVYTWNEELLEYDGYSYSIKLEVGQIYYYQGKYYMATSNASRKEYNSRGLPFPEPWDSRFSRHLIEVPKP